MIDEKPLEIRIENRRIRLPDNYPAQVGSVVFLTASIRGCLMLYQMQEWLPVRDRIFHMETTNDRLRTAIRFVIGYGEELIVDKDKMILISTELSDLAELGDTALWMSQDGFVEIWNPARISTCSVTSRRFRT